jgi:transcriptional regulator with XRE-family HTH domain
MVKYKLIAQRKKRKFSQQDVADRLYMDQSQYSRREKGIIQISEDEWNKLAQILKTTLEDIFESEKGFVSISKDAVAELYQKKKDTFYQIPVHLLEIQKKYIRKLEEENAQLKELLRTKC